jgi:hypothetical protein
MPRITHAQ